MSDARLPEGVNPRSVTVEGPWLPTRGHEGRLRVLEAELEARGVGWQVIEAMSGWLRRKAGGRPDPTEAKTRARYRKLLAELVDVDPDTEPPGAFDVDGPGVVGAPVLELHDGDLETAAKLLREAGFDATFRAPGAERQPPIMFRSGVMSPAAA
jgi:hypothetical protein